MRKQRYAAQCNKKAQLSLTNPRDACEKFAWFMQEQWGCNLYSLPIDIVPMVSYIVTVSTKCVALEILALQNYRDLETRVRGHSRSSKVTPFDSLHMVSYYRPIVTLCLKCTIFKI